MNLSSTKIGESSLMKKPKVKKIDLRMIQQAEAKARAEGRSIPKVSESIRRSCPVYYHTL